MVAKKKQRGIRGQALVELDFTATRNEADFPLESRSPWRLQFAAVMEAWHRGGIDDGDFVLVARFGDSQSAGRYLKRFSRAGNSIVPRITDPTGETLEGDNVWAIKAAVVRDAAGVAVGSELWVAIVPADPDEMDDPFDDNDRRGDRDRGEMNDRIDR